MRRQMAVSSPTAKSRSFPSPIPLKVMGDGTVWAAFPAFALRVEPQERLAASRLNRGRMTEPVIIGRATLYLRDCREIIGALDRHRAVITDPAYGIPIMTKLRHGSGDKRRGNARRVYNNKFDEVEGNDEEFDPVPLLYFDEA